MNYWKFTFKTENTEILLAFLGEMPFDSFIEKDMILEAFLPQIEDVEHVRQSLIELKKTFPFTFRRKLIPQKNWNSVWEKDFDPITIDNFCHIRTESHPKKSNVEFEIIINPEMSFGTGHHQTTFMMINAMRTLDLKNKKVLDFGAGTGVLSVLAAKMGAQKVIGLEIEPMAFQNSIDNANRNAIENYEAILGDIDQLPNIKYDVILANINRNIILESINTLYRLLNNDGWLLCSGFLLGDFVQMKEKFELLKIQIHENFVNDGWLCMKSQKK